MRLYNIYKINNCRYYEIMISKLSIGTSIFLKIMEIYKILKGKKIIFCKKIIFDIFLLIKRKFY